MNVVFILINAVSLINAPSIFLMGKGGQMPQKLALGHKNILFLAQLLSKEYHFGTLELQRLYKYGIPSFASFCSWPDWFES